MHPMMTLGQAMQWLSHAKLVGASDTPVLRVHTDTRTVESGDLFIALRGERFDAHAFLAQAEARGAAAVLCHAGADAASYPAGLPRIEVPDTRVALAELAAGWRAQFDIPLIAVTGSNGKTTVTQMVASILQAYAGDAALATQGNLNNDIGVPLTLLRLRPHHRIAVVELGMNHRGEIAQLAALAQPTVALVNNAQREHLEFMHTIEAVARENGSVLQALRPQGVAVFPKDDAYTPLWEGLSASRRVLHFAVQDAANAEAAADAAEVLCHSAQWAPSTAPGAWQVRGQARGEPFAFALHIAGAHNLKNAMAAIACTLAAGVPLEVAAQGLQQFVPVKGRSRTLSLTVQGRSCTVVDDTYNANPDSVRAAIEVLASLPGPHLLVLGDMGEVGAQGPAFHAEAGSYARAQGIAHLYTTGELARCASAAYASSSDASTAAAHASTDSGSGTGLHFDDRQSLNAAVLQALPQVQSVLVKGSRFMRMEQVVEAIFPNGGLRAVA